MYVEPNSTVYLMKNVPLDPTYQHTVLFSSKEQQANTFLGYTTGDLTFVNQSYQRHGRGYIKIATNVGNVLNCNYMMFRNYNSETMTYDRWFYAFVTDVEYVNEATTLIRYEIDIMQTWLFDYSLDPVFVEREHSSTDVAGDNLLDEPIDYGDYIFRNFDVLPPFKYESGNMGVAIYFTSQMVNGEKVVYGGKCLQGVFAGGGYTYLKTPAAVDAWFTANADLLPDNIIGICMIPNALAPESDTGQSTFTPAPYRANFRPSSKFGTFDGYVPKNNKIRTYPYTGYYMTNGTGSSKIYHYEDFTDTSVMPEFRVYCNSLMGGDAFVAPVNYKGTKSIPSSGGVETEANFNEAISVGGFPMCSYSYDAFKAWWAQNQGSFLAGMTSQLTGAGATGLVALATAANPIAGLVGAGISVFAGVTSALGTVRDKQAMPGQLLGDASVNTAMGSGFFGIWGGEITIRKQYAIIIDQYWSKFGYPCRQVKVPNRNARANWNYVKTQGCEFTGSIPASDAEAIKAIYDNGVTFWNNINNVGKYGDFTNPINT